MVFQLDMAFALELLALAAGAALVIWGLNSPVGKNLALVAGLLVALGAIAGMAGTVYYGIAYHEAGHFDVKAAAPGGGGMGHGGGMMKCPMMEKMMKEGAGPESRGGEDHSAHH
ncbi:MAG: hypothetical protein U1F66_03265 [bacterium]